MNINDLKYLLSDHKVPHKPGSSPYEISINCPQCKDKGFHMQLNPTKSSHGVIGWGFCYKSWHAMPLWLVLFKLRIKIRISDLPEVTKTTFEKFEDEMNSLMANMRMERINDKLQELDLSKFQSLVPTDSWMSKKIVDYLNKRGITDKLIQQYQLMYDNLGELNHRVIIPFFENHKPVYYQARTILDKEPKKILNPSSDNWTLDGKSQYLYNFDQAREYEPVVINEGWASAITTGPWAVALSGKVASDRQLELLDKHWSSYVVLLDADAHKEALELACKLMKPGKSVRVASLPDGDPNDYEFDDVLKVVMQSVQYSSVSEVKLAGAQQLVWL